MDTNSKFIVCNVNDWHEFMKLTAIFNTQAWLFRGQADSSWKLQTTHERFINNRKSKFEFRMNNSDPIMRSLDEIVDKDIISPNEQILKNAENYAIEKFK